MGKPNAFVVSLGDLGESFKCDVTWMKRFGRRKPFGAVGNRGHLIAWAIEGQMYATVTS